jgi:hypothetical protein
MDQSSDTIAPDPVVLFKDGVDSSRVSGHSRAVLVRLLRASGNPSGLITRATATPEDQARVMYDLIESHGGMDGGVTFARKLWFAPGQRVVDTYVFWHEHGRAECIAAMAATIRKVGPEKVSHHCGDPSKLAVLDVAPSSLEHPDAFLAAAHAETMPGGALSKVLAPANHDPAFHLEIPQPTAEVCA